jgi:hypothetical protein
VYSSGGLNPGCFLVGVVKGGRKESGMAVLDIGHIDIGKHQQKKDAVRVLTWIFVSGGMNDYE